MGGARITCLIERGRPLQTGGRPARHARVLSDSPGDSNSAVCENRARGADATGNGLTIRPGNPLRPCGQRGTPP